MEEDQDVWPPSIENTPPPEASDEEWLYRRGLTGIKIALFGGLLPLGIFLLGFWLDPDLGGGSQLDRFVSGLFRILYPFSLLVMLVSEILAFGYGVEAWRSITGKLAIGTVFAIILGLCLFFYVSIMKDGLW